MDDEEEDESDDEWREMQLGWPAVVRPLAVEGVVPSALLGLNFRPDGFPCLSTAGWSPVKSLGKQKRL
ncbi:hypothetical protein BaRGS_00007723 [Batillaria attramentaria]|uniref:Uncharacterized protein n=1 Tax=Batillaria attramentaria TaxID=370345 RepID=A0ABD0LN01_9CAEN